MKAHSLKENGGIKLNLGCGSQTPQGWINVDYAIGAKLSKLPFFKPINDKLNFFNLTWNDKIYIHNLKKPFPWSPESVDIIYSSHTLEHFTKTEGRQVLEQSYRVLKKGGIIRIVVPDLVHVINQYLEKKISAVDFLEKLGVLTLSSSNRIKNKLAPLIQFPHKCMYDSRSLLTVITEVGFQATCKKPYESEIPDIHSIEMAGRTNNAVIVEGYKK